MPPLVVDVMNAHRAALLRRERTQMSAMAQRWLGVERALQAEIVRFTERLQQDGLTVGQMRSRQFQLDRFASLLRQVRVELDRYSDYAAPLITGQQREYAATGIDHAADAINAVGEQAGVIIKFDKLPVGAVENLVGLAGDGSPLRSLLQSSFGVGAEGMFNQLIAGVALGRNPQVVARMMVRDGLSQSLTRMMLIARTEQLRVYRESSRQTYISSGVVERYKRLASKSRRTCAACLMADGQIYELDEPFDEHPAGRCQLLPVVAGLPPVRWTEGRDWFTEQSPEVQRSILGPGRFDAWRAGAFDLDQLVSRRENPVWGGALVPTPLRDLLAGTAQPVTIRREPTVAEPLQAPTRLQPSGPPVSDVLTLPSRGQLAAAMREALAAIDSVHGDGTLPSIPVKAGPKTMAQQGYFKWITSTGQPIEIKVSNSAEHPMNTLAHEIGHFIEKAGLLPAAQGNQQLMNAVQAYETTVKNSGAFQRLQRLLYGNEKLNLNGLPYGADMQYMRYLLRSEEIWARSYAQYIAVRSQNSAMLEELRKEQAYIYPVAWQDADFEPIAAAIDELFKMIGWLR